MKDAEIERVRHEAGLSWVPVVSHESEDRPFLQRVVNFLRRIVK